ncbi:MAG: diguanylate cyclase [Marinisporobacter sp.]|jgi:GGDEF domain-containing protein|nr:diguanylate cyclase [Marinisporobacter sp.]
MLVQIGERLKENLDGFGGVVGRVGGDEFIAIVPNLDLRKAKLLYNKIDKIFNEIYLISDCELNQVKLSITVGMEKGTPTG